MPRNALTSPASLPSTVPDAVFTCGPAAKTANGGASMIPTSSAQRMIFVFIGSLNSDQQNTELYRKEVLFRFLILPCPSRAKPFFRREEGSQTQRGSRTGPGPPTRPASPPLSQILSQESTIV